MRLARSPRVLTMEIYQAVFDRMEAMERERNGLAARLRERNGGGMSLGEPWDFLKRGVPITINLNVSGAGAAGLGPVLEGLAALMGKVDRMATDLDTLTTEVSEIGDVVDSAIALIRGIKAQLDAAGADPAKLRALSASLDLKAGDLARAVAENTPEPTDGPPPEDGPAQARRK